jgi:purine-binding chemotaxis protein CheW
MSKNEYLTIVVAGQEFGVLVTDVTDVLRAQATTRVPKASADIAGALNLRGRIVTAIDLRTRMGLPAHEEGGESMHVVIQLGNEAYGLVVDSVGDVIALDDADRQTAPPTLAAHWIALTKGVYRLPGRLLLVLDVAAAVLGNRKRAA